MQITINIVRNLILNVINLFNFLKGIMHLKNQIIIIFHCLIFFQILSALPRFAVQNGASCTLCHVNPTGGSLRNDHGTTIFSMDELPMEGLKDFTNEDWTGFLGDFIEIGADFRMQGFSYTDTTISGTDIQEIAIFPMQADIYTNVEINDKVSLYYELGLGPEPKHEYWAIFPILPNDGWLRIGRTLPNYGLKLDDHTSFIRGGNLKRTHTNFSKEGMPFNPLFVDIPGIIELGLNLTNDIGLTVSIANSFASNSSDPSYGREELKDKNFTAKLSYIHTFFDKINLHLSPSYMKESALEMMGVSGGISIGNLVWTYEIDQTKNWPDTEIAFAGYNEIAYQIKQGIHLIGKYDFFDPEIDWASGAITRYTIGMELYPFNILEIKLQTRFTRLTTDKWTKQFDFKDSNQPNPEYLIQFHTWF